MAPKAALPALVLLALVCGDLAIGGHSQTLIGGPAGTWRLPYARGGAEPPDYAGARARSSPAAAGTQQPPAYTPGGDGTGRVPAVEEEKAFMVHSLPEHDRARPVPVPPTAN